jgi:hypothetical protein
VKVIPLLNRKNSRPRKLMMNWSACIQNMKREKTNLKVLMKFWREFLKKNRMCQLRT